VPRPRSIEQTYDPAITNIVQQLRAQIGTARLAQPARPDDLAGLSS
jgi:hypothetical protein